MKNWRKYCEVRIGEVDRLGNMIKTRLYFSYSIRNCIEKKSNKLYKLNILELIFHQISSNISINFDGLKTDSLVVSHLSTA